MSMRSDFLGELQSDALLFDVRRQIDVPPLREPELIEVVSRPAELLSAKFDTKGFSATIARRTAEESAKDAGALPLLSYLLDDMWTQMVERRDGVLCLPGQAFELGSVLVRRANAFVSAHPDSEHKLRRIFTLKLATVREGEEPTRRRAWRSEFSDEEWRLVSELADNPNRLLVTATPDTDTTPLTREMAKPDSVSTAASREAYAEVAHEAIFRHWDKLREWIAAEREFLAWKTGLEAVRRAWQATPDNLKIDALLMGAALTQAQSWCGKRSEDISAVDREFVDQSTKSESKARVRARRVQALAYVSLVGIILGISGVINEEFVKEQWNWYRTMRPYRVANVDPVVLKPEVERALKPGDAFRECAKDCPVMIVVPAGEFMMGSPETEKGRSATESPQHRVAIARPFAVSKFEVTFAEWDACVSVGGCPQEDRADDPLGWGRGTRPVIYVNWRDARTYLAWLSRMTGKAYRLLTESEWEYAARAGTTSPYSWGDEIGRNNANCMGCGSQYRQTAPVGSFKRNAFDLFDMHGNVWEWVEDCYHINYEGAPTDGSPWTTGDCRRHSVRGGAWNVTPQFVRTASRGWGTTGFRDMDRGFRVGRTLANAK
jgi:formylglycine-generating enzyme required for sulfatase activity